MVSHRFRKKKGIQAERELLGELWFRGLAAVRVAGSGSSRYPTPDIIAGNHKKTLALECKVVRFNTKYFPMKEIKNLLEFSKRFNAEPWIAVKHNKEWGFVRVEHLRLSRKGFSLNYKELKQRSLIVNIEELVSQIFD